MTPELPGIASAFLQQRERRPSDVFLRYGDAEWTWAETASQSHALACALQELGVERGDRIGLNMPNWPEFVLSLLAASELGATVVPLNPAYSQRELQFVLRNTECSVVVTAERFAGVEYLELFEGLFSELPGLQYLVTVGEEDLWYDDRIFQFEDLVSAGRGRACTPNPVGEEDPAAILYTAGVSQKQKGVVLSHSSLLETAARTAAGLGLTEDDVTLCAVPLFNIFGLGTALLSTVLTGGLLLLQEQFDARDLLDLIGRHRPTVLHGVPTMFVLLRRELQKGGVDPTSLSSLRTGIIAGAPVAPELVRALRQELIPGLEIAYGLTETSPTVTMTGPDDGEAREESVGRPIPDVELKILGEGDEPVGPGETGEVVVHGPNVMLGYFRQPAATRTALTADGFLKTGDLGTLDSDGYLRIVGRRSDVILRGGYSVHPREIEDHLRSLPAVQEAVVIGLPNEVLGELVCACVVPVEGALVTGDEIRELCRPALSDFKLPDVVHLFDALPEARTGRERRQELVGLMKVRLAARGRTPADGRDN
ncbi:MAG: AMP-binding protein [Gemmatimonadota bacterium]